MLSVGSWTISTRTLTSSTSSSRPISRGDRSLDAPLVLGAVDAGALAVDAGALVPKADGGVEEVEAV